MNNPGWTAVECPENPVRMQRSFDLKFLNALAQSAAVAIYHADPTGHLTYVNARFRTMFSLRADQSIDDWASGVHPLDRERMQTAWANFCSDPRAAQFEWRSLSRDGEIRYLTETVVPVIPDGLDGVDGFVGTITDVTDLKQAEEQLDVLHRQLVDASRQAGRAEIATSVLHNVGNVLNSVNVSATLVIDTVRSAKSDAVSRVVGLLNENARDLGTFFTHDERGQRLIGYLSRLADQHAVERDHMLAELSNLQHNIDQIKEILAMQQNYAKLGGGAEPVDLTGLHSGAPPRAP